MRMKRWICVLLAILMIAGTPATAQGSGRVLVDDQGLYLQIQSIQLKEDKLRINVVVENDTGHKIDIFFRDAYADGVEVESAGIFDLEDGEHDDEEFFFFYPMEGDSMAVLRDASRIACNINVKDVDSGDKLFTVPVAISVDVSAPTPDFPTDAKPTPQAAEIYLIIPENSYGEWQFVNGNMLKMRVTVENTFPARAVEAFEIYMYATDVWGERIYGENYVYYETTEAFIEPFETAFSTYVTLPDSDKIDRVYAGIHRVRYDDGSVVEADEIDYRYWDIE